MIKNGDADELAKLVKYPLFRRNPLPNIPNKKAFVAYYNNLFDRDFKRNLLSYHDSVIFDNHTGRYGLVGGSFRGEVWIDKEGNITTINTMSRQEIALQNKLTKKIQNEIYPTINTWEWNILVGRTGKLLIRVDWTKQGLRYVAWKNGQPINTKPDLILNNGEEQSQGTIGGWTYTFKSGEWTYVVNDMQNCDDPPYKCGYFLEVFLKGKLLSFNRLLPAK